MRLLFEAMPCQNKGVVRRGMQIEHVRIGGPSFLWLVVLSSIVVVVVVVWLLATSIVVVVAVTIIIIVAILLRTVLCSRRIRRIVKIEPIGA